jgi:hypothetical protein
MVSYCILPYTGNVVKLLGQLITSYIVHIMHMVELVITKTVGLNEHRALLPYTAK